ncbi:hypothetical protein [Streptomyces sp. 891-h]|uniref:hypothetical protein n=1 Tax=unclassified Streptomyces TaxID=2593676 RepID=UPI001FA97C1E|nr:hypothetical protein [Streptomyces sp. 891-h]UNZ17641.1 hypothetical protein HC362_11805 [Streptomyces sp. 891-h]
MSTGTTGALVPTGTAVSAGTSVSARTANGTTACRDRAYGDKAYAAAADGTGE